MNVFLQFILIGIIYSIGYVFSHTTNLFHFSGMSTLLGVIATCLVFVLENK